jgi:hypothetical protein
MTNKSEELCKLLGIEAEINCKNCLDYDDGESEYSKSFGNGDCSLENEKCYCVYPDLTKPSNFVKLLELIFETLKGLGELPYDGKSLVDTLINGLIQVFNEIIKSEVNYKKWNKFRQQAQQTEWEY